ncbi:MAG TPA: CpsD/CapB family tyrosine-protein kinase [Burkholderiales bacterium]|nr:CpsD/CapB family tyrosine-protein kinase [Burkholderiales bacterium]
MRWRIGALVVAIAIAFACAAAVFAPPEYLATGAVLLPEGMLKVQFAAPDPYAAAALVRSFIEQHANPLLVDPPVALPSRPADETLALATAGALLLGLLALWRRRAPVARSEGELIAELGAPLLAARPLEARELSRLLVEHWFSRGRGVLAVASAEIGKGHTRVAAELARAFARDGAPTLLIDGNLRAPRLHRALGLRNRAGLADFLDGGRTRLQHSEKNLSVMVAGRTRGDPLELLSRPRMQELLAAAAKRYRVVLIDTPAAACGPDLQLSAAFAGGALVVASFSTRKSALAHLRELLSFSKARVVGTVLSPA